MAEAPAPSPVATKRRTSGASVPVPPQVLDSVSSVHGLAARTVVTLAGHLVQVGEQSRNVAVRGRGDVVSQNSVYTCMLADASCAVQFTLWGEVSDNFAVRLEEAYESSEDGVLPRVHLKPST